MPEIISPNQKLDDVFFDVSHHLLNDTVSREHGHDFIEIVIIVSGCADHYIGGMCHRAYGGCVTIFTPGSTHRFANAKACELYNITCTPEVFEKIGFRLSFLSNCEVLFKSCTAEPFVITGTYFHDAVTLLRRMYQTYYDPRQEDRHLQLRFMFTLLLGLISISHKTLSSRATKLTDTARYIEVHCTDSLELDTLAKQSGMSKRNFIRRFKEEFDTTPMNYQRECRMQKACALLKNTDMHIDQIALACGFFDGAHFIRIFTARFGVSPGKYRKSI